MNKGWYIFGGVIALALWSRKARGASSSSSTPEYNYDGLSYLGQDNLPRGMRNNNPGNLRISANAWQGKIPVAQNTDGAFEQFYSYPYGLRAMVKLLINYINVRSLKTLRQILFTYAPSSENDTNAYVQRVAAATGIHPDIPLYADKETLRKLTLAMAEVENGRPAVTNGMFDVAWSLI